MYKRKKTKEQLRIEWNKKFSELCRELELKQDAQFWIHADNFRLNHKLTPEQAFERVKYNDEEQI